MQTSKRPFFISTNGARKVPHSYFLSPIGCSIIARCQLHDLHNNLFWYWCRTDRKRLLRLLIFSNESMSFNLWVYEHRLETWKIEHLRHWFHIFCIWQWKMFIYLLTFASRRHHTDICSHRLSFPALTNE